MYRIESEAMAKVKCRKEQTELEFEVVHLTSWLCYLITHRKYWRNWFKRKQEPKNTPKVTLPGQLRLKCGESAEA
jgi:hypothetical protein